MPRLGKPHPFYDANVDEKFEGLIDVPAIPAGKCLKECDFCAGDGYTTKWDPEGAAMKPIEEWKLVKIKCKNCEAVGFVLAKT